MKLQMFMVFDSVAKVFQTPYFAGTLGEGERMFQDACNDDRAPFKKHPKDYTLYHMGELDQATGFIQMVDKPVKIVLATQFVKQ